MKKTRSVLVCIFALPTLSFAQSGLQPGSTPSRWSLGLGVGVSDSVYAGEGTKSTLLPLIQYQGERFFLRGLTAGAHLYRSQTFGLDAIASARMDGIKVEDFGVQELAKNGINRSLLVDRDGGVDMGLAASWRSSVGKFELIAKADVTGTSEGFEVEAKYGYDFMMWSGKLTPNVGVSYLSKDMANYYYGTLDAEVARGVVDYKPGAATIPKIGLTYARPVGEDWTFITSVKYQFLPSKISDSPLLKSSANGEASFMFGLSRSF